MYSSSPLSYQESSDDSAQFQLRNLSDCIAEEGTKSKFKFPPPPRLSYSETHSRSQSESSNDGICCMRQRKRNKSNGRLPKRLPPLGIFWDIENCQVPKLKSAAAIVQKFRTIFLQNYRESEFIVVCDVRKEQPQIIQELHDTQVNLIHVSSTSKNAADEKLRQSLRRFAEVHTPPSAIVLISSDINFAADLSDLRYRKKIRVILVHNNNVADALILCANEHHSFSEIVEDLPSFKFQTPLPAFLMITNLPLNYDIRKIKTRLKHLTDNCGGRITEILSQDGTALIRFSNIDVAQRAEKRIQGEDVFGNKIQVLTSSSRNYNGRKLKNWDGTYQNVKGQQGSNLPPPPGFGPLEAQNFPCFNPQMTLDRRQQPQDFGNLSENSSFRPIRRLGANNVTAMDVSYDLPPPQQPPQNWLSHRRSPQDSLSAAAAALPTRIHTISGSSDYSDDSRGYHPSSENGTHNQSSQPVDLLVTNLDSALDNKELRRQLKNMFKEFAMILSLNIIAQPDGTRMAHIKVSSLQEAQFTISQLHRQKLGNKRIVISYAQTNSPDPAELKAMVIRLLQEVPDNRMPLFKFIELFESRYHCLVSVSEIKKLKDVCLITEQGPRIISLTQEVKSSPLPNLSRTLVPYCTIHCSNFQRRGWCETSDIQTPCIMMTLKVFTTKLNHLLNTHMGCMHLLSFQSCYEQEHQEPLPVDENGVPLEHLIACVPNTVIKSVGPNKNIKVIMFETNPNKCNEESVLKNISEQLAANITLLSREIVDFLKTTKKCQILLNKFIPAYHHHFGRQCRVADYGFTKLVDLFESIPHVVQIMGDGCKKVITLSHAAQMRRFTSDVLRILKVQPLKQISLSEFPTAYEKVMNKSFNAVEYGLCTFEDLLEEVSENTIAIKQIEDGTIVISIPKREQTSEEIMRTKQFAVEVIDLLKHSPYYTILFNKFVPAYHHHFGHQCKVSDYGFIRLIELFEAIPDIVKIEELADGDRVVSLTTEESLKILGAQVVQAIKNSKMSWITLDDLPAVYLREVGYPLKPHIYECDSVAELAGKLCDYIEIIQSKAGTFLVAIDMDTVPTLIVRGWALLLKTFSKDLQRFKYEYQSRYSSSFSMKTLEELTHVFTVRCISPVRDVTYISLTPLFKLAAELYTIIYKNGGSILYENLEKMYLKHFGETLHLSNYNLNSVHEFYNQFNMLFFIRGKKKSIVELNRNLAEHQVPLPASIRTTPFECATTISSINRSPNVNNSGELVHWLSLPSLDATTSESFKKKKSPPKPDTPQTPGAPWSCWDSPSKLDHMNLEIDMPIMMNPTLLGDIGSLMSPARLIWNNVMPSITPPHPTEVPMPDKLISSNNNATGVMSDDSTDSGVNTKLDNSQSDRDTPSFELFPGAKSNKNFEKYLNFH